MIKRCLQALLLLSIHATLALGADARYPAWRNSAAQALIARGDAGSLATAAALSFVGAGAKLKTDSSAGKTAVELAARASELEPNDASIGWLRLQLCAGTPGCDIRDAATTLRWIDADNAAVWLPTLAAAQRDKDGVEIDRVLQEMGRGSRFDFYWSPSIVLWFDTLRKARAELPTQYLPSDLGRLSEVMLLAGAEIVPPLAPLANACRDAGRAERRENCLKLAKIMQRADTVGAQMAGFNLEKRLSAPESREARATVERRRVLEWRVATASQNDVPALPWLTNSLARGRIAQLRATPREEDVDIAILRKRKLPLEPPPLVH